MFWDLQIQNFDLELCHDSASCLVCEDLLNIGTWEEKGHKQCRDFVQSAFVGSTGFIDWNVFKRTWHPEKLYVSGGASMLEPQLVLQSLQGLLPVGSVHRTPALVKAGGMHFHGMILV